MNFYIYKIEHIETKEFYFGSRGCKCKPDEDKKYLGSMYVWKPDKNKLTKTIISNKFKTRDDALIEEANLIKKNINNPLNRNYHIPYKGYHTTGIVPVKDKNGNIFMINKNDIKILNGELNSVNKGMTIVKDKNNNKFWVNIDDPRFKTGEIFGIRKGIEPINKGIPMSEEQKIKLRKPKSEEHKKKLSEVRKNMKTKKIICLTNGIVYDSMKIAAQELKLTIPNIVNVLKGRAEYTKGFSFRYF